MRKRVAICLLNMGGPDSIKAVRPFLYNLFSDRDIIRLGPALLQRPIAWFIARRRAPKSAKNYKLIGGKSPLTDITLRQAQLLERRYSSPYIKCAVGMRYWHPRTPDTLKELKEQGVEMVLGLSMYPHYSKATSGSSLKDFKAAASKIGLEWAVVERFPDHPLYIQAISKCMFEGIKKMGIDPGDLPGDFHLVYSAHSLPKRFIDEGDPYLDDIKTTIGLLEKRTGITGTLSFQSRSGPVKWLEPATDEHLLELVKSGKRRILCLPISFVSDHIETLYEIDILFKNMVKAAGGELFMAPGLNTRASFIKALYQISKERIEELGWLRS